MNTSRTVAALSFALTAAFAGSAFADDTGYVYPTAYATTQSRAKVQAEYLRARAAGEIAVGEASVPRTTTFVAQKTRGQVQAETLAAVASGELRRTGLERVASGPVEPTAARQPAVVTASKR